MSAFVLSVDPQHEVASIYHETLVDGFTANAGGDETVSRLGFGYDLVAQGVGYLVAVDFHAAVPTLQFSFDSSESMNRSIARVSRRDVVLPSRTRATAAWETPWRRANSELLISAAARAIRKCLRLVLEACILISASRYRL